MSTDHDHADPDPVTDRTHENSWSANLEQPEHADNPELLLEQAVEAIERTAPGYHVNLVTHGDHGHPSTYLFSELDDAVGDAIEYESVEPCGCGGHVTRVFVRTRT
jgi:putative CGCGG family rSAM target protein